MSSFVRLCPESCHFNVTFDWALVNISNNLWASAVLTIGSYRPSNNIMDLFERSGITVGEYGTIARNKIAPARDSGRLNRRLAAIFAPLEYPTAMILFSSNIYFEEDLVMNSANSSVLIFRSSKSKTPSSSLLKNLGIPFSRTLPLTLRIEALGANSFHR